MITPHPSCPEVEFADNVAQPSEAANAAANAYGPDCFTEQADAAVMGAVASLYLFAHMQDRTVPEFKASALRTWEQVSSAYGEDGAGDTEARCYFWAHMDNVARLHGWVPFDIY